MVQTFFVPVRLWGLNEIIAARASKYRGSYSKEKRRLQRAIVEAIAGLEPFPNGCHVTMEFHEPNRKRDPDGFTGGGAKVILDSLQHAGVLRNDGWADVLSLTYTWVLCQVCPGVKVTLRSP